MWCFPTLERSCFCCSLKTGMYYICFIGLFWNWFYLFYGDPSIVDPPALVKFLDRRSSISKGDRLAGCTLLYYSIQIFVMFFGLFGTFVDSLFCVTALVVSEGLMLIIYFVNIITYLLSSLYCVQSTENPLILSILFALHYYLCSIIFSFYNQLR